MGKDKRSQTLFRATKRKVSFLKYVTIHKLDLRVIQKIIQILIKIVQICQIRSLLMLTMKEQISTLGQRQRATSGTIKGRFQFSQKCSVVQCAMYNVHCTMYNVHCSMQCTMYSAMCNVPCSAFHCKRIFPLLRNTATHPPP